MSDIRTVKLPVQYDDLSVKGKRVIRERYIRDQNGECIYCGGKLHNPPPMDILNIPVNKKLFPNGFFDYPVHLQHSHMTGLTEGAVHAYCNALMWEYDGR